MKALIIFVTLFFQFAPLAVAATESGSVHTVEKYISNIRDRVRQCSILPYEFNANNVRVERSLRSHCPEVKLIAGKGALPAAKIHVAGQQFTAQLIETQYSDGDFYDVEIRNVFTNEIFRFDNVLAYGDILLGVLGGETKGVSTAFITE
jgi:hypothetical protein